ncbi:LysR family transcriptional regulator [Brevibacillus reuszeri]|uniref:Molybdopterin molybdenumtransferase n=1 Tax=Brevibacillus reuszeri TaxID=54915 RepID=A0A0K9YY80_9BACL|nr:molybdopterin biosynthesis protein [Brevibacillus reuszeri]KNB73663.1 LysR family transcriptional regulator [Brevibacillus reuszeri]MED1858529.1 molybdopterin biosynthesis protein [Brevibacillus reuszeri]GED69504.1 LysR family transcriptional regulator [Brevibacillus reuszeri]
MRKIYLEDTPLKEAQEKIAGRIRFKPTIEVISTREALGRVTAASIYAKVSMPNFHASAMDGVAVRTEKTYGACEQHPVRLKHHVDYVEVDTGDPIPDGYDAVIMIEHIHQVDSETIEILEAVAPWQHIRPIGEDVVVGEMIVPDRHKLRPVDLGALLAGGNVTVPVLRKPRVAIIPTGTELIEPTAKVASGEIIEFNGTVFAAYLQEWGAEPVYYGIVKDDYELIRTAVSAALEDADMVLLNAGSSAGREDFTVHVVEELGEVLTHGVATRPGKPVVVGVVNEKPVIGLPGYPVSAYLNLEWFARSLVYHYYGLLEPVRQRVKVIMGRRIVSVMGAEDFIRVTIGSIDGQYIANPLTRSAGVTMSMVRADGLLRIPPGDLGYEQGEEVEIELYRPLEQIQNTMVATGSHDLAMDVLHSLVRKTNPERFLVSSHVGSMSGIMAIQKGEAHVAGVHLFDEHTGEYNQPFIEKYLRDKEVVLIQLVYRQQGWFVKKGNPLGITSVQDLIKPGVTYMNRQRGAGTRLLFDYLLKASEIDRELVYGYSREAVSHLSVAAAVAGGTADVGLGIYSAAHAMDLDFIPVSEERYDLVMSASFYRSSQGQDLLACIRSNEFMEEVEALGGYSCRDSGKILYSSFSLGE